MPHHLAPAPPPALQADQLGNVNVSRFGSGRAPGCGGFIDISQTSRAVVYMGTFTSGGLKVQVSGGVCCGGCTQRRVRCCRGSGGARLCQQQAWTAAWVVALQQLSLWCCETQRMLQCACVLLVSELMPVWAVLSVGPSLLYCAPNQ